MPCMHPGTRFSIALRTGLTFVPLEVGLGGSQCPEWKPKLDPYYMHDKNVLFTQEAFKFISSSPPLGKRSENEWVSVWTVL